MYVSGYLKQFVGYSVKSYFGEKKLKCMHFPMFFVFVFVSVLETAFVYLNDSYRDRERHRERERVCMGEILQTLVHSK